METINQMRKSVKEFVENLIYKKDEYDNYIYMNCIKDNKLSSSDLWLRKQKFKINNYEILSEQMFIHYGCLIYKDGYEQDKIEKIFSYFKEVDYLVRNYSNQYSCLSEELKILKDNTSFLIDINKKILGNNVKKFLFRGGQKSLDCLNDLLFEFETNPLVKYIYFMHNYVERGFDLAVSKTITSDLYRENQNFIDDLRLCSEELNNNNFRINLHNLKELMVFHRNSVLKIIDKYGYKNRVDFINELSKTIMVMKSFCDGVIHENNIINEDLIKWLSERKPIECSNIENIKYIYTKEVNYYDEKDKSLPYLPKSLFRIEEKINIISNYIDALESLSHENRKLLQIQENIAQTLIFGIETLTESEKENLIQDIDKIIFTYDEMKKKRYGITSETKIYFEKKMFSINKLKEALSYLRNENFF
jgi:hypothetical protein